MSPVGCRLPRDWRPEAALAAAPVAETRVCQYENTSNGYFLIDQHPDFKNVWLAGGGSGHGFKHGPAVAEYLAGRILDLAPAEPRFSLASKQTVQQRAIFYALCNCRWRNNLKRFKRLER